MPYMQKKQNTTSQNMGYRPFKVEQLFLSSIIPKKSPDEKIIVHFVLENTFRTLHLQIERRLNNSISFERVFINQD